MYHRVMEECSDPWGLCVTPATFAAQLEVLRKFTHVIRLRELVDAVARGAIVEPCVVVTFDDGYADNLLNAKPLLEYYDIPATIFLATGYLGGEREFWWDELDRLLLHSAALPETLRLGFRGKMHQWELGNSAHTELCQRSCDWKAWETPLSPRHQLYVSLWKLLQPLTDADRQGVLLELRAWANLAAECRPTHRTLTVQEVCGLAREGLVEIGCHTVTHSILSSLSSGSQEIEIRQSKKWVEEITGIQARSFSYPYGSKQDYTQETVGLVRDAGFGCACSTIPAPVTNDSNLFELPRFQAKNWVGDEFAYQLSLWFDS
jgi:peptidoglycan/xylan/chitin deacetylase (PgdA/CDA1 family)